MELCAAKPKQTCRLCLEMVFGFGRGNNRGFRGILREVTALMSVVTDFEFLEKTRAPADLRQRAFT